MAEDTAAHPDGTQQGEVGAAPTANAPTPIRRWPGPSERFLQAVGGSMGREFCRRHLVVGSQDESGSDVLRIADGAPPWIAGNIAVELSAAEDETGRSPTIVPQLLAVPDDREEIARTIDRSYPESHGTDEGQGVSSASGVEDSMGEASAQAAAAQILKDADTDLLNIEGKGPVIRLVDMILFEALSRGASDVHVQPLADRTLVRFRVDGVLHGVRELPAVLAGAVISRIKIMARMDVAEHGAAQDGRATVTIGGGGGGGAGRPIDLRVSTLPTAYGERAVIRLLDTSKDLHLIDLARVGMLPAMQEVLVGRLNRAHGIVLVTGPTGSGKTTTLYAALRLIASPAAGSLSGEHNIMTIEDPIEYELSTAGIAVSQTQTNPKKGLTFATGLRHMLRQDPDVVMVGEIRDQETARMAMQASLTGHLVLSTLHTNDAATAVTRLVDLGIEAYLVSASLSAVLAQRLVRKIHTPCGGAGCDLCLRSGYSGRIGVFELLVITDQLRELIGRGVGEQGIREAARQLGMRSLMDEGQRLVETGVTTLVEVERVIQGLGT